MTDRPVLRASKRTILGKEVARLRRQGLLPGVVFGHGESIAISVDAHELEVLRRKIGANALVDLAIEGVGTRSVLVSAIQHHAATQRPIHADFHVVNLTEELTVEVPVVAHGIAPAVDRLGGTLVHVVDTVKVRAQADHLPREIDVHVEVLQDFDSAIHVRDLVVPAGVAVLDDPDEIVIRVLPPRVEAAAEEAADAAAAAAASAAASAAIPSGPALSAEH
jgi:large subunit ribosomal protein L25